MTDYLFAAGVIFAANVVPAFAPPTWLILVFFVLNYDLQAPVLIVLGIVAATVGRAVLAYTLRHSTRWLHRQYVANRESAGRAVTKTRGRVYATLALFFVSPLSSAQLFAGAGMMKSLPLRPLLAAFAAGRSITYTTYVVGAGSLKATDLGQILVEGLQSPWGIAAQVALTIAVVAIGFRHWNHDGNVGETPAE